jgi:hypothetical protein
MMRRTEQMRRRIVGLVVERREQGKVNRQQNKQFCRRQQRKIARNAWPEHGRMLTPRNRPGLDLDQRRRRRLYNFCNFGLF